MHSLTRSDPPPPGPAPSLRGADLRQRPRQCDDLSAGEALPGATSAAWQDAVGTAILRALEMSDCATLALSRPARRAPSGTAGHPQPGRMFAAPAAARLARCRQPRVFVPRVLRQESERAHGHA